MSVQSKFLFWRRYALTSFCVLLFTATFPSVLGAQLSTQDRLSAPAFWPTKPGLPLEDYAGSEACASCHAGIYSSQIRTSMALTASPAASSRALLTHDNLNFSSGAFHYSIRASGSSASYQLASGAKNLRADLAWAFGTGRVGQSYLFFSKQGTFREARVSYFSSLQNLNFTPSRGFSRMDSPERAMYRDVAPAEVKLCFSCHTTAAFASNRLDQEKLFPGVTCEACHGPGANHVSTMQSFVLAGTTPTGPYNIFNPASLAPSDAVDFCGACHGATWDVILSGLRGVVNTRAAPYRLQLSKCWGRGDARLLCWSCHNPHEQIRAEPESYDRACLDCHRSSAPGKSAAAATHRPCPVATSACVTCHMPKFEVPEMHYKFTDHRIRIVRPGAPYQE